MECTWPANFPPITGSLDAWLDPAHDGDSHDAAGLGDSLPVVSLGVSPDSHVVSHGPAAPGGSLDAWIDGISPD